MRYSEQDIKLKDRLGQEVSAKVRVGQGFISVLGTLERDDERWSRRFWYVRGTTGNVAKFEEKMVIEVYENDIYLEPRRI
jgi:hypothetical protein